MFFASVAVFVLNNGCCAFRKFRVFVGQILLLVLVSEKGKFGFSRQSSVVFSLFILE